MQLSAITILSLLSSITLASAYRGESLYRRSPYELEDIYERDIDESYDSLYARDLDSDLHARSYYAGYEDGLYARGQSMSSEKKAAIERAKAAVQEAKENLARVQADTSVSSQLRGRLINDAKMKLMNAQGNLEHLKKG